MTLKLDREWYLKHAALDEPAEVAAGEFSFDKLPPSPDRTADIDSRLRLADQPQSPKPLPVNR